MNDKSKTPLAKTCGSQQYSDRFGLFTWALIESLSQVSDEETWASVFYRCARLVSARNGYQHPRAMGNLAIPLEPEQYARASHIKLVHCDDHECCINVGAVYGFKEGGVFEHAASGIRMTLTRLGAFSSTVKLQGPRATDMMSSLIGGHLVVKKYGLSKPMLRVLLETDDRMDQALVDHVKSTIDEVEGIELVEDEREADWRLSMTRDPDVLPPRYRAKFRGPIEIWQFDENRLPPWRRPLLRLDESQWREDLREN